MGKIFHIEFGKDAVLFRGLEELENSELEIALNRLLKEKQQRKFAKTQDIKEQSNGKGQDNK